MRQARLRATGKRLCRRLMRRYQSSNRRPQLWFTYHLYHKAPDWLGPGVCQALAIPYVVAEASYAPKQANGPWAEGHRATAEALSQAAAVVSLNRQDVACIRELLTPETRLISLRPFHESSEIVEAQPDSVRREIAASLAIDGSNPWLLTVAMMRPGDKMQSYRLLAWALEQLSDCRWQLIVVGDGSCRSQVEATFNRLGGRAVFAGLQSGGLLHRYYTCADFFVWPAINEAYGMAILEAQSAGLPVVAGRAGGVPDIVRDGLTGILVPQGDANLLAGAVRRLLDDRAEREQMANRARQIMAEEHQIGSASRALDDLLRQITAKHPA